jgi:hypothetical protein
MSAECFLTVEYIELVVFDSIADLNTELNEKSLIGELLQSAKNQASLHEAKRQKIVISGP